MFKVVRIHNMVWFRTPYSLVHSLVHSYDILGLPLQAASQITKPHKLDDYNFVS
jgi:hypothetical protein